MFQDVLLDSASTVKAHRGMSAALSFFIQAIIVAIVVIIPLLVTQALPSRALTTMLVAPPPPPPPPPPPSPTKAVAQTTPTKTVPVIKTANLDQLRTPTKIPTKIDMRPEQPSAAPPPSMAGIAGGVPGGVAGGQIGGVVGGVVGSVGNYMPSKPAPQRVRVSQGVTQGLLIKKVEPQYPPIAKQARVQGTVVLQAEIAKDGSIQHLQAVSGSPLLVGSAIQAVKQWKYKPYILNGQPVEIETTITVNFHLT